MINIGIRRTSSHETSHTRMSEICEFQVHYTCLKGFEQKVATLRLKTLLKIKENFIGNKTIAKEITRNAGPS